MNRYKKLASDTVLMVIGNFSSKILIFILLPFYTYILSQEEYGVADLFTTTISMLVPVLTLAISESTFRFAFDKDIDQGDNLRCSLTIISASCIVLLPIIVALSIWNENFETYSLYFLFLYAGNALNTCLANYARGTQHIKIFVLASVFHAAILATLNIIFLAAFEMGLRGYLLSMIFALFGSSGFIYFALRAWENMRKRNLNFNLCGKMLKYSIPIVFSTTAWWAMNSVDKYMIIDFYGIEVSGLYGVSQKIPTIISVTSSIFVQAWQISAINSRKEKENNDFYTNVYKVYELGLYVMASLVIFLTKPLASIMFQKEYYQAYMFVPILVLSGMYSCLASFLQSPFLAEKKSLILLESSLTGVVVNIVANIILMQKMGVIGATYATMIGFVVTWLIRYITSKRFVNIKINWWKSGLSMALLLVEALIITYGKSYWSSSAALIVVGILAINRRTLKAFLCGIWQMIDKYIKNQINR